MRAMKTAWIILRLGMLSLLVSLPVVGQTTSNIEGTVKDPKGAVVAGAQIKASSPSLAVERTATSDENGFYRLSALPAGTYLLTVSAKNFANSTFENVELTVNRTVALRSEEHTSELQSRFDLVCRLLLEKKKEYTTTDVRVMNWNGLRSCT